jgi:hypothetical protein
MNYQKESLEISLIFALAFCFALLVSLLSWL